MNQSNFSKSAQGITTTKTYDAWNISSKKQTYAIQRKIKSPLHNWEDTVPMYRDTTGGSRSYTTDRRTSPRVREHFMISKKDVEKIGPEYSRLPTKTLTQKGFHMSNLKMTKYNIPNAVSKRGGILGKSLGIIAMVGVNMLKKSAMGINKGARVMVDYATTKGVLGAARLGLQRGSKTLKTPSGLVQALSRSRHGRG